MRRDADQIRLSASDLSRHLGCRHLTQLDREAVLGNLRPPIWRDPALELLQERGLAHENAYVQHLRDQGRTVVELRDVEAASSVERTARALREGVDVVVQADLRDDRWHGRADVLLRVAAPSALGDWSYEIVDTKLAQDTRAGTILQLCLYADLVGELQGRPPELLHVVKPGDGFTQESYRFADYQAYYRYIKRRLEGAVGPERPEPVYPVPVAQCDICRWWRHCDARRREDDHLSLVAGIGSMHVSELERQGVTSLEQLGDAPEALRERPSRGTRAAFERIHHQARVQLQARREDRPVHELLPLEEGRGFMRLPQPSPGDLFFDFEADHFAADGGLEYLFGLALRDLDGGAADGPLRYRALWARDRGEERSAFRRFIDLLIDRWRAEPGLHVYHFAPYEPAALKRLASRHGTREHELDELLRAERFVDLHAVTRQGLRAGVERYSLKHLEPFSGFTRAVDLRAAGAALRRVACALELGDASEITEADSRTVGGYNRDDCLSTAALRDWLETLRAELIAAGSDVPRPAPATGEASDAVEERHARAKAIFDRLVEGVPEDRDAWSPTDADTWLLAHELDYFRREDRCYWWEYFHLHELEHEALLDERKTISGLELVGEIEGTGGTARCPVHRYRFPPQEVSMSAGNALEEVGGDGVGKVNAIDTAGSTVDIKKTQAARDTHPRAILVNEHVRTGVLEKSLLGLAESVIEHGIDGPGPFRAARDLLLRRGPRPFDGTTPLRRDGEPAVEAAIRLVTELDHSVLSIQGPPGTGKTHTGAHMIASLARAGKRVGVTAVSHKVIRNLLEKTLQEANDPSITAAHKGSTGDPLPAGLEEVDNDGALAALDDGRVVGGTAWLWARDDAAEALDFLFVDEAGQMSLAHTLAAARAARSLVLLGDPCQLEQPQRGAHPEGAEIAALDHVLDGHQTMPAHRGLFLDETYRLHPELCAFTSELFYEGRLRSRPGLERQTIAGPTPFAGSGLRYVMVDHEANQNHAPEEAEAVARVVESLCRPGVEWIDADGARRRLRSAADILVVAPYNAHVAAIRERLPDVRVGTVDKFQGQQAPVVIYSMASSSAEDAPRGMSFLYNPNRLNVATSRARCVCILVAAARILEPECRTPEQMRWANGLCRFREMATLVDRGAL